MKQKTCLVLFFLLSAYTVSTWAGEEDVWVGTRFLPKQCLEIAEGKFDVRRKLCTIAYNIRSENDYFLINAHLRFDKMFIPDTVSDVELAILLIDTNRVCTRQINIHSKAESSKVDFTFAAQKRQANGTQELITSSTTAKGVIPRKRE